MDDDFQLKALKDNVLFFSNIHHKIDIVILSNLIFAKAYKQIDNYYINQIFSERMKKRFVLLLACLLAGIGLAIAQTPKTITGVVISEEDNQPVVGASVLVKGTAIGTTTNVDGKFTISNVPSSARTKSIGYPLS